jgi:hypothetical protein
MSTHSSAVSYFLGLDLGQAQDYSALVVLETTDTDPPRTYAGRHLQRWSLGTSYPTVAKDAAGIAEAMALSWRGRVTLAVDATGVGRAVVDLLRREPMPHVHLIPILITGGDAVTQDKKVFKNFVTGEGLEVRLGVWNPDYLTQPTSPTTNGR